MTLYDHYLIQIPKVFDELETNGIIGRNTAWYIEQERDRYARKVRKGLVIAKPHAFTEDSYQPIDPGVPNPRVYLGHDQIQEMRNAGRKSLPEYYPSARERIDWLSLADIGRLVDVEVGEEVWFHPNVSEPENLHQELEIGNVYKAFPDVLICANGRMQAGWVFVEPIQENNEVDGFVLSVEPEHKMLEGIVRNIRNRPDLRIGDHVYFQENSNWEYEVDGKLYFAMKEENIWMKRA